MTRKSLKSVLRQQEPPPRMAPCRLANITDSIQQLGLYDPNSRSKNSVFSALTSKWLVLGPFFTRPKISPKAVHTTQFSVIQTIYCNVGLKCFFNFAKMLVIIVIYAYFIDISQGSVKTHLWCGKMCNNHVIANCSQSVPVKEFSKSINNWRRYG